MESCVCICLHVFVHACTKFPASGKLSQYDVTWQKKTQWMRKTERGLQTHTYRLTPPSHPVFHEVRSFLQTSHNIEHRQQRHCNHCWCFVWSCSEQDAQVLYYAHVFDSRADIKQSERGAVRLWERREVEFMAGYISAAAIWLSHFVSWGVRLHSKCPQGGQWRNYNPSIY